MKYDFADILIDKDRQSKAIYKALVNLRDRNNSASRAFLPINFWENVALYLAAITCSENDQRRQESVRNLQDYINAYS